MDCWDGEDGEPIIYHGWTLTSKILFQEVIKDAILPYAFHTSQYPLILSIENHCSIAQQDKMAQYMKSILRDKLYVEPVDEDEGHMPSPETLMGKVLVKAKRLPQDMTQDDDVDDVDTDEEVEEIDGKKKDKKKAKVSVNLHAFQCNSFYNDPRQSAPEMDKTLTYVRQSLDMALTATGQTLDLDSCLTEVGQRLDGNRTKVGFSD